MWDLDIAGRDWMGGDWLRVDGWMERGMMLWYPVVIEEKEETNQYVSFCFFVFLTFATGVPRRVWLTSKASVATCLLLDDV